MRSAALFALFAVVLLSAGGLAVTSSDRSDAVALPPHDELIVVLHETFYTNSHAKTVSLRSLNALTAEFIALSYHVGKLSVDRSGAPSWITYAIYPERYEVELRVAPGSPVSDTFWILFNAYGSKILLTFEITVLDGGGVIPNDNYRTFTLRFDTRGGSSVSDWSVQSLNTAYTFDLSQIRPPERDGHTFKGWSNMSDGSTLVVGKSWTVTLPDGSKSVSYTLYAVWQEDKKGFTIPTVWDDIIEFLSEPMVIISLVLGSVLTALFIRWRLS